MIFLNDRHLFTGCVQSSSSATVLHAPSCGDSIEKASFTFTFWLLTCIIASFGSSWLVTCRPPISHFPFPIPTTYTSSLSRPLLPLWSYITKQHTAQSCKKPAPAWNAPFVGLSHCKATRKSTRCCWYVLHLQFAVCSSVCPSTRGIGLCRHPGLSHFPESANPPIAHGNRPPGGPREITICARKSLFARL